MFLDGDLFSPSGSRRSQSRRGTTRPRRSDYRRVSRGRRQGGAALLRRGLDVRDQRPARGDPPAKLRIRPCGGAQADLPRRVRLRRVAAVRDGLGSVVPAHPRRIACRACREASSPLPAQPDGALAQRAALLRGRCHVLEKAASRADLNAAERRQVTRALTAERREALLAEAHEALIQKASHARVLAARVAGAPSMPLGTRLKAIVAAVAPGLAARRLKRARALHGVPGPAGGRFPL